MLSGWVSWGWGFSSNYFSINDICYKHAKVRAPNKGSYQCRHRAAMLRGWVGVMLRV